MGGQRDIRERDLITVEMVVEAVHQDHLVLQLKPLDVAFERGGGVRVSINVHAIVSHRAPPLAAGAQVKYVGNPNSISGRILHIIGEQAWIAWGSYDEIVSLSALERENRAPLAIKATGGAA